MNDQVSAQNIQFCKFVIDSTLLGVEVAQLREINSVNHITPIHHTPDEVLGYVNIRGQIHLVIDIRPCIGLTPIDVSKIKESKVLIFKSKKNEPIGIVVDDIKDITYISSELIDRKATSLGEVSLFSGKFLSGICRLPDQVMFLIDIDQVLTNIETKLEDYLVNQGYLSKS